MNVLAGVAMVAMAGAGVWPPPKLMVLEGDPTPLTPDFHAAVSVAGAQPGSSGRLRLGRAVDRFNELMAPARAAAALRHTAGTTRTVAPATL